VPVPLYQRIAEDLHQKIRSGEFPVSTVMPAELLLMERYGASRNTIRGALKQLQDMGLVSRRRNRGTVVERPPAMGAFTQSLSTLEDLVSLARTAARTIESSAQRVLDIATARELGCAAGSRWLHIAMTRREGDAATTLGWTDAFVDIHYAGIEHLAAQHPDQLLCDLIESSYGRRIVSVDQKVHACAIDGDLARKLDVQDLSPGLKVIRQYRDPGRAMVLVTRTFYPGDRYVLASTLVRTW
jgi:DNA-binding GntR family transcriptional regulator